MITCVVVYGCVVSVACVVRHSRVAKNPGCPTSAPSCQHTHTRWRKHEWRYLGIRDRQLGRGEPRYTVAISYIGLIDIDDASSTMRERLAREDVYLFVSSLPSLLAYPTYGLQCKGSSTEYWQKGWWTSERNATDRLDQTKERFSRIFQEFSLGPFWLSELNGKLVQRLQQYESTMALSAANIAHHGSSTAGILAYREYDGELERPRLCCCP